MKTIKIGMMGTGFMGKAHSNAFLSIPFMFYPRKYELECTGICASSFESAKLGMDRYSFKKVYGNYSEMLADAEIDIFDNAGPDPLHYKPVMEAIKYGKHIYCEKPLAINSAEAKEMYTAAEAAGIIHMTGFNYRFFPANILAKKLISEGAIGKILHTRFLYDQPYGVSEKLAAEDLWYNNTGKADGVGQAIGTHVVDMARFLAGEIVSLSGVSKIYRPERPSRSGKPVKIVGEESSLAHVDFDSGATGTIESTQMAGGMPNNLRYEIFGTRGSLTFTLEKPSYLRVYLEDTTIKEVTGFTDVSVTDNDLGHPYSDVFWPKGHNVGWEHGHIAALAHFFDCVAENKAVNPIGATFFDGYAAEKVIDTIKQSCREGKRIDIVL